MNTNFNPKEVLAAAPDSIALGMGTRIAAPHPLAEGLTLANIAYACGYMARKPQPFEADRAVMGRGMGTSDFAKIIADGVKAATVANYQSQAEHLAFVSLVHVKNFKPVAFPALDADIELKDLNEFQQAEHFAAFLSSGANAVRLVRRGRLVKISREAVINDQRSEIGQLFAAIGGGGAREEARFVANALETNVNLDDGAAVFGAEYQNVVAGGFDSAALGEAIGLLRTQPTAAGQRADLRARHLVVEPALELKAREIVRNAGLDIVVSVLANLPAGRWYVLADPLACPTVGVLRLMGAKTPLTVEQRKAPVHIDGACIMVTADLGAAVLRRIGIVRGGVA